MLPRVYPREDGVERSAGQKCPSEPEAEAQPKPEANDTGLPDTTILKT